MSLRFFLHTIKWFHLVQSNTNTQLNVKTVLFQTIQTLLHWFLLTPSNLFRHSFFTHCQNDQAVLFQITYFSLSTPFKCETFLLDPEIGPYQVLPLRARVDVGAIAMKGYSAFLKVPALLKTHDQIV